MRSEKDALLLAELEAGFANARDRAGEHLVCAAGCSDCCVGPFPITRLDRWRLQRGMQQMRDDDPQRAARILERSRAAAQRLKEGLPTEADGRLSQDEATLDAFFQQHQDLACPALDPDNGHCELYAHRPISCRTYGPPIRFGETDSPPCDLCFKGADAATIEACRWTPDADDQEQHLLATLHTPYDEAWETLIAFALEATP